MPNEPNEAEAGPVSVAADGGQYHIARPASPERDEAARGTLPSCHIAGAASSRTDSDAEGLIHIADEARKGVPSASHPNEAEAGQTLIAIDDGRSHIASPASADGLSQIAEKAWKNVPSASHPNGDAAGQEGSAADGGHDHPARPSPHAELIDGLKELQVRRLAYIRATNRITNAAQALTRRALGWAADDDEKSRKAMNKRAAGIVAAAFAGKSFKSGDEDVGEALAADLEVFRRMAEPAEKARHANELAMRRLVRSLPVYEWAKSVRGFGDLGLAVIIAEAGDLAGYPTHSHLSKRFGLAPYNGKACSTWRKSGGLTSDEWKGIGYKPSRRAEMFAVIGDPLIKQGEHYRDVYLARCAREHEKAMEDGLIPATNTKTTVESWEARGLPTLVKVTKYDERHRSAKHMTLRAQRYMEQRLLRDLWKAWRRAESTLHTDANRDVPAAATVGSEASRSLPHVAAIRPLPPLPPHPEARV